MSLYSNSDITEKYTFFYATLKPLALFFLQLTVSIIATRNTVCHRCLAMKNSVLRTQASKTYAFAPEALGFPHSLGGDFHDDPINRSTLRKSHNLLLERKTDYAPHAEYLYASVGGSRRKTHASEESDDEEDVWEGWLSEDLDKSDLTEFVVRMRGYFMEEVPESPLESERVRQVCISFFLKDDSVSITELGQRNSGIDQSKILSRRRVPKDPSNPSDIFLLDDFSVGESVTIYGQRYYIVDMDKRSRRYFAEILGKEVGPSLSVPEDNFARSTKVAAAATGKRGITSDDMDYKRTIEQQLTGIYTKHSNEDIAITKEFLKNKINEHLTYLALWDDRGSLSGDLHYCIVRLFLENSAIEIVENRPENSGRYGGPVLVSRQRIPHPAADLTRSRFQQHTYGKLMKNDYLTCEDIQIGETYMIYSKPFYVYDCDKLTREYAKEKYGIDLNAPIDIAPFVGGKGKSAVFYPPPPNGFGSERETRSNWLSLVGKPAKVDHEKILRETGRVMTFSAKLVKPLVKGDEDREFVISFHRETDELEIFEKPKRNSGFMGGRFLAKGKHYKDMPNGTAVPFTASDFKLGEVITIFQRPFLLTGLDEGTVRILEGSDKLLNEDRIKYLVLLLKQQLNLKFSQVSEAYLSLAPQGTLGYVQLKEFLHACSCDITDEEALLVIQNLSPGTDGVITYSNFLHILDVSSESMDEASLTTRSIRTVTMDVNNTLKDNASVSEAKQRQKHLRILLQQKLIQRKGSTQEQFRLLSGHSANSRMNRNAFRTSLNTVLHFNLSKADEDSAVSLLFDGTEDENGDITYKQFQEFVDSCSS